MWRSPQEYVTYEFIPTSPAVFGMSGSTLNGSSLKLVYKFTYQGSSVSSTKTDINMQLVKAWTAIDRLLVIWKSDLTDKMKHSFFQAVIMLVLLYGCTTWTLTKCMERKLESNYTRMLQSILNKSKTAAIWPLITHHKTILVKRTGLLHVQNLVRIQ